MRRALLFSGLILVFFSLFSGCKDSGDKSADTQFSDRQVVEKKGDIQAEKKDGDSKIEEPSNLKAVKEVELFYFYGTGCPNCEKVKPVINSLAKRKGLIVKEYEVWYNKKNRSMLLSMARERNLNVKGVPAVIIGNDLYMGVKEISGIPDKLGKYYK